MMIEVVSGGNENRQIIIFMTIPLLSIGFSYYYIYGVYHSGG
jgi:hypothetical protein